MQTSASASAQLAWILFAVFTGLALLCALALLALRGVRRGARGRGDRRRGELRADVLDALLGGREESGQATARLAARRGPAWDRTAEVLVDLLPKVRGEARDRALDLLRCRGAATRALRETRSRRSVTRCRGAYTLGALGAREHAGRLIELLADPASSVRRVAARALGAVGDETAVEPLLTLFDRDSHLQRDLGFALVNIGLGASPQLRRVVLDDVDEAQQPDRGHDLPTSGAAVLAASVLGMLGDPGAVPALVEGVHGGRPALVLACVRALGEIESPAGLPALEAALGADQHSTRIAAATSIVAMGSASAIPALVAAVETDDPTLSRAAATALLRLGAAGRDALTSSGSRYAAEAVALADLRSAS